jgi:hypothetical protein
MVITGLRSLLEFALIQEIEQFGDNDENDESVLVWMLNQWMTPKSISTIVTNSNSTLCATS